MLNRIRMVMVNTSHPGNIGAAARAMKTMGLSELFLVAPKIFPDRKADEMASGATDLLTAVKVVATLEEAIADCTLIIGTSARSRAIPWPHITPREMAAKILLEPSQSKTAIVFGREQTGLTNDELQCCHCHVQIPASPLYSSLNIAAAMQVIAYELRIANLSDNAIEVPWDCQLANADDMERLFAHIEETLIALDFLKASAPRKLMTRLRRLFLRARPDVMEMNILRGILTAMQANIATKSKGA